MCSFVELCPAGADCRCALDLPEELQPWSTADEPNHESPTIAPLPSSAWKDSAAIALAILLLIAVVAE